MLTERKEKIESAFERSGPASEAESVNSGYRTLISKQAQAQWIHYFRLTSAHLGQITLGVTNQRSIHTIGLGSL